MRKREATKGFFYTLPINLTILFILIISVASGQILVPISVKPAAMRLLTGSGLVSDSLDKSANFSWIPAKNSTEAAAIWNGGQRWTFLNMAGLSGTKEGGAATLDIINDFIGPVRFSVLGNVASSGRDSTRKTEDESRERFLAGGGTGAIVASFIGPTLSWGKTGYLMTIVNPKLGFEVPVLGSSTNDSNANFDMGGEIRLNVPMANNDLGIFGTLRGAYVSGGSGFYNSLALPESKKQPFTYSQFNIGLSIPKVGVALLYSKTLSGPDVILSLYKYGRVSLIVSPGAKK